MRKILLFLFATGLLAAGAYVLSLCLAHPSIYNILRTGFGAAFLLAMGGYLLWDDFIRPFTTKTGASSDVSSDDTKPR